jgi:Stress responsive A/B Barrel Domain
VTSRWSGEVFTVLRIVVLPSDHGSEADQVEATLREAAAELPGVVGSWAAPVSPVGVINAGDVVWRTVFRTESEAMTAPLAPAWRAVVAPALESARVTSVGYRVSRMGPGPDAPGIWRGLIFRIMPHGFPGLARQLEQELLLFPKYISTIRGWALSPVSFVEGPKAFTHVWEQEYDDLDGLTGEYMTHPIHWGLVDRFFDAESPVCIVDPQLTQIVGPIGGTILGIHGEPGEESKT